MSYRVYIFDTTLRDGEQSPGCSMNTRDKLRMARQLVELGVDILEAGFPIASDGDFEATQAIAREFRWAQVAALARAVRLDVERALKALEPARRPRLHCFIATSDIHLKHKLKKTQEQVLEDAVKAVELARQYVDDVEFSAEDGSRTDSEFLCRISRAVIEAGARTINIPDTVGYGVPDEYAAVIRRVVEAVGDRAIVSVHTHDDLGLATANAIAAVNAGARQQLLARRSRHDHEDAPGHGALHHRHPHRNALSRQPVAHRDHRGGRAAEQGHCGQQRVCARGGHSPGWLPQGADLLRDHPARDGGGARRQAGAGQAQRPARTGPAVQGPGLSA